MDRRRAARRAPAAGEPLARMRARTGRELVVLNVSDGGALVEGASRLLPGTHIDVHVMTPEGRVLVRSRVVRALVSCVHADAVRYQGALVFDRDVNTAGDGYVVPDGSAEAAIATGTHYPGSIDAVLARDETG